MKAHTLKCIFSLPCFFFFQATALADSGNGFIEPDFDSVSYIHYQGSVNHVFDGDTIRVVITDTCQKRTCPEKGDSVRVRLAEIDAPESDQAYGKKSESALRGAIGNRRIDVLQTDVDQYGRSVGEIYYKKAWVNGWLVRQGHAWVYPDFALTEQLFKWQKKAQRENKGLWQSPEPVKPWEWRRNHQ